MKRSLACLSMLTMCSALVGVSTKSASLTQSQQLAMYRNCRQEYSDKNIYFAKKMCGCLVQGYLHDTPVAEATLKCIGYANTN